MKITRNNKFSRMNSLRRVNTKVLKYELDVKSNDGSRKLADYVTSPIDTLNLFEHLKLSPILFKNIFHSLLAFRGLNHKPNKSTISSEALELFVEYAKKNNVKDIGYVEVIPSDVMSGFGVLYKHAIVFTLEMGKSDVDSEPCFGKLKMIESTYADSGEIANKFTRYLKKRGYGAQSGPGAGGLVYYPVMAERAGIGVIGRHGLLISKSFGPRTRLAVVFTNINNLPETKHMTSDMAWVSSFCAKCGKCIKACPHQAIYEHNKTDENHTYYVDHQKCLKQFEKKYGCTICLKECLFTKVGYQTLCSSQKKR